MTTTTNRYDWFNPSTPPVWMVEVSGRNHLNETKTGFVTVHAHSQEEASAFAFLISGESHRIQWTDNSRDVLSVDSVVSVRYFAQE